MRSFVENEFYNCLNDIITKDKNYYNLIKSVRKSPKTENFLKAVTDELNKATKVIYQRRGKELTKETLKMSVWSLTKLMLKGMDNRDKMKIKTNINKNKELEKIQYLKDLEATASGTPTGDFLDLEVFNAPADR